MALKRLRRIAPGSEPVLEQHYLFLLITLLTSFILSTLPRFGLPARILIGAVSMCLVFAALRTVWHNKKLFVGAVLTGLCFALARLMELLSPSVTTEVASDVMVIGFLAFLGYAVLLHTTRGPRVTMDTIYGAACVYFMLGLLWTAFYRLVFLADPQSFHLPDTNAAASMPGSANTWCGYFSMITLATIGYGDHHAGVAGGALAGDAGRAHRAALHRDHNRPAGGQAARLRREAGSQGVSCRGFVR